MDINKAIPISVFKYFTDTDGYLLAPGDVPEVLQNDLYPVWMFGNYDRKGGYLVSQQATPPKSAFYIMSYTFGIGTPFLYPPVIGLYGGIYSKLKLGDIVHIYTDDYNAPSYYIWIIQRVPNASVSSIVENTSTTQADGKLGEIEIKTARVYLFDAQNDQVVLGRQFQQPLRLIKFDNAGNFKEDQAALSIYLNPMNEQRNIVEVRIDFKVTQFRSINFLLDPFIDRVDFLFTIK